MSMRPAMRLVVLFLILFGQFFSFIILAQTQSTLNAERNSIAVSRNREEKERVNHRESADQALSNDLFNKVNIEQLERVSSDTTIRLEQPKEVETEIEDIPNPELEASNTDNQNSIFISR